MTRVRFVEYLEVIFGNLSEFNHGTLDFGFIGAVDVTLASGFSRFLEAQVDVVPCMIELGQVSIEVDIGVDIGFVEVVGVEEEVQHTVLAFVAESMKGTTVYFVGSCAAGDQCGYKYSKWVHLYWNVENAVGCS